MTETGQEFVLHMLCDLNLLAALDEHEDVQSVYANYEMDPAWLERRLELFGEFASAFDEVFSAFLDSRLDEKRWKKEAKAIRKWVAEGADGAEAGDLIEIHDE